MDIDQGQEKAENLAKDIFAVLRKHHLSFFETFLVLASTIAAVGNDDAMEEETMIRILRSAIEMDKRMQHMEMQ